MTKQHFIALAETIKFAEPYSEPFTDKQIALLSNFCKQQNTNFKCERWIDYIKGKCGPNGGKVNARV